MNNKEHLNGHAYPAFHEPELMDEENPLFLTDESDHDILMHRDAHFGGSFEVMLQYYEDEDHVGIQPEFDLERIEYLAQIESQLGENLAATLLTGPEAERISKARLAYEQFKELYDLDVERDSPARLIADLILTEKEEPEEEIQAVIHAGSKMLPDLLRLVNAEECYDPLFPGYGYAPYLAIICLGEIADPQAIIPLFESLNKEAIYEEEIVLEAFAKIGEPAKAFLLKTVKARPLTQDNVHAAFALLAFSQDLTVAVAAFQQLQDPDVQEKPLLRTYLLCSCDALGHTPYHEQFIELASSLSTPIAMREEMESILKGWI